MEASRARSTRPREDTRRGRRNSLESVSTNRSDASSVRREQAKGARVSSREAARRKEQAKREAALQDSHRPDIETRNADTAVGDANRQVADEEFEYTYETVSDVGDMQQTVAPMHVGREPDEALYAPLGRNHADGQVGSSTGRRYEYQTMDGLGVVVPETQGKLAFGDYDISDDDPAEAVLGFGDDVSLHQSPVHSHQSPGALPRPRRVINEDLMVESSEELNDAEFHERLIEPSQVELPRVHNTPDRFAFVPKKYQGIPEDKLFYGVKLYEEGMKRRAERERLVEEALERESPIKHDQFKPRISRYARGIQWEEDVVNRLNRPKIREEKVSEKQLREEAECTFAPDASLLANSLRIARAAEGDYADEGLDRFNALLNSFNIHERKRVEKLQALVNEKRQADNAPFVPTIHPKSAQLHRPGNVHERLYRQGKERKAQRERVNEAVQQDLLAQSCTGRPETHEFHLEEYKRPKARGRNIHTALHNDVYVQQQARTRLEISTRLQQNHERNKSKLSAKSLRLIAERFERKVTELFDAMDIDGAGALDASQVTELFRGLGFFVQPTEHTRKRCEEEQVVLQKVWTLMDEEDSGFVVLEGMLDFLDKFLAVDRRMRHAGGGSSDLVVTEYSASELASDGTSSDFNGRNHTPRKDRSIVSANDHSWEAKALRRFVQLTRTSMAYDPSLMLRKKTEWQPDQQKYTFHPDLGNSKSAEIEANAVADLVVNNASIDKKSIQKRHELIHLRASLAERKKDAKRRFLMEEKMQECTFKPRINQRSEQIVESLVENASPELKRSSPFAGGRSHNVSGIPVYSELQVARDKERRRLEARQTGENTASAARELEMCTFRPEIHSHDRSIFQKPASPPPGYEATVERLRSARKEKEELARKLAPPHEDGTLPFKPEGKSSSSEVRQSRKKKGTTPVDLPDDPILFFMDVNVGLGRAGRIGVRAGDDPAMLAEAFGVQYQLETSMVVGLESLIEARVAEFQAQRIAAHGQSEDLRRTLAKTQSPTNEQVHRESPLDSALKDDVDLLGDNSFSDISGESNHEDAIVDGPPRVSLRITGSCKEGSMLLAKERYTGGVQGDSQRQWIRVKADGRKEVASQGTPSYVLSGVDAGCKMVYQCRPVRDDGMIGRWTATPPTKVIQAALPMVTSLTISGDVEVGSTLEVSPVYVGGIEGVSSIRWYRCDAGFDGQGVGGREPNLVGEGARYVVSSTDVSCCLRVDYTPVRSDGVEGDTTSVVTQPVAAAVPRATGMGFLPAEGSSEAVFEWGTKIMPGATGVCAGGFGIQQYRWYRMVPVADGADEYVVQEIATTRDYIPVREDVGFKLKFVWTPVGADGLTGEPVGLVTPVPIQLTSTSAV